MEFFAAAAFWAMIVCAVVSIIGLLVRWWRRSAATIETWRRLAARPDWRMPLNDDLTVDVLSVGNAALITVQGSLTIQSAQAVSNCIRRLASEGKDHIVLDLSAAHFPGLEALTRILAQATEVHDHGGALGIVAPREDGPFYSSLIDRSAARTYRTLSEAFNDLLVG
jgi:anti-anti-sigma regulatory factor